MEQQGTLGVGERTAREEAPAKGNVECVYELSPMQQGMLFQSLKDPESGVYITQQILTLGKIDVRALEAAWQDLVNHFPVFRTAFSYANRKQVYQIVLRTAVLALQIEDWRQLPPATQAVQLADFIARKKRQGVDFNRAPLMSVALLRFADEEYRLVWTHHHIILDGWSLPRVYEALLTAYAARLKGRAPKLRRSEPFESYIHWLKSREPSQSEAFWREYLDGFEGKLPLPLIRADQESGLTPGVRYDRRELSVPAELYSRLKQRARTAHVTLNAMIQLAWGVLLSRYNGVTDVVFGAVTSGRPPDLRDAQSIVGLLINTIPVRVQLDPSLSTSTLLARLHEGNTKAKPHECAALADIARWSGIGGGEGLFDTILAFENYPLETDAAVSALPILDIQGSERPHNPLTLAVVPGNELLLHFFFDAFYYKPSIIESIHGHLVRVLQALADDPARPLASVEMMEAPERAKVISLFNRARTDYPRTSIDALFEECVERAPKRTALVFGEESLSYESLNEHANRLATTLVKQGVRPGDAVAVLLDRSLELVVAMLAILKAGGVYVPLDTQYPEERLRYLIEESRAVLVLTQGAASVGAARTLDLDSRAAWAATSANLYIVRQPAAAAYVMYTSGSTGRPKAVVATHQAVLRLVSENNFLPMGAHDVFLQLAPVSFDASTLEIWGALLNGARLVIAPPSVPSVAELKELLLHHGVTTLWLSAAFFNLVVREDVSALRGLRNLLAGGDVLHPPAVRTVLEECPGITLINGYGPTENTTFTCCHPMRSMRDAGPSSIPIGRPVSNTTVYVVDESCNPVSIGVVGELVTGGDGLAHGYYGQSALTAQRFVPDPFSAEPGSRLYRTGDRVRWREDGVIEFLGRQDHQVKVRGYRIELGEIETHLNRHEAVAESVVLVREEDAEKSLVAYYIPRPPHAPTAHSLREHLLEQLPVYMVPSFFVALERFPMTANGKLDRAALPAEVVIPHSNRESRYEVPLTVVERTLVDIWEQVLKIDSIGIHDNFFELGGDSILSIQIASRANKAGYKLGIKDIFAHPTIHQLAQHCTQAATPVHAPQADVSGRQVLLPVQEWFFEQRFEKPSHWNQSFLLDAPAALDVEQLEELLHVLVCAHDALRMRFSKDADGWSANYAGMEQEIFAIESHDLRQLSAAARASRLAELGYEIKGRLHLQNGPLLRAALLDLGEQGKQLLLTIHHLIVDTVSWRVLLEDLERLYRQRQQAEALSLPAKSTPYQYWGTRLEEYAASPALQAELDYWTRLASANVAELPLDHPEGASHNVTRSGRAFAVTLDANRTRDLLERVHGAYNTRIDDFLLCALARAYRTWSGSNSLLIHLEGHGREDLFDDVDLARTVGWFTTIYPVLLESAYAELGEDLKAIKEQLRLVPGKGIGYGLLRHVAKHPALLAEAPVQMSFTYLGQFDQTLDHQSSFRFADGNSGSEMDLDERRAHLLDVAGRVQGGQLTVAFYYSHHCHDEKTIQRFAQSYLQALEELVAHCLSPDAGGLTPSDIPLARLSASGLLSVLTEAGVEKAPHRVAGIYPASPLQSGMLLESLKSPGSGIYITQPVLTLRGVVDVKALEAAWRDVIQQFPIFRTAFAYQDREQPLQVVLKKVELALDLVDWRELEAVTQEERWQELTAALKRQGFAFGRAPLMSVTLARFAEDEYRLVWTHHHIILDGWSLPRVFEALLVAYEARLLGQAPHLKRSEPYESYIKWLHRQDRGAAERFWRDYLQGIESKLPLPLASTVSSSQPASTYATYDVSLSSALTIQLRESAREQRITLNSLVQTAWSLLLSRFSGNTDVVFGAVTSGRPPELREAESIVGLLINTVPVRVKLDPMLSVRALLDRVQQDNVKLRAHEHVGLADIGRWSGLGTDELFDTIVAFENYPLEDVAAGRTALPIADVQGSERPHNPLTLACVPGKQLEFRFFYDTHYYDEPTLARLAKHLTRALEVFVEHPDRLISAVDLRLDQERRDLPLWNATSSDYPRTSVVEAFEAQARRRAQFSALVSGAENVTYDQLNQRANRLAHTLVAQGVRPGETVGLLLDRSSDLVIAMLAILKAGAAYVPLDTQFPEERLRYLIEESRAKLLLIKGKILAPAWLHVRDRNAGSSSLPALPGLVHALDLDDEAAWSGNDTNPRIARDPASAVYLMYTSGSTGQPKAVVATHQAVLRLVSQNNFLPVAPEDVFLQLAPASFDASTLEIWGALLNGARLAIAPPGVLTVSELKQILRTHGVTTLWLSAAFFNLLVREDVGALRGLSYLLAGGDVLQPQAVHTVLHECPDLILINGYGPTENTTFTCCHSMRTVEDAGSGAIPIGRPVSSTTVYVVDESFNPVPTGVAGELVTGGDGLAQGYYGRSALTAERFIPNPFATEPGSRLYRTGDRAKWREDGVIEFLGRQDHQVKVRGFRIELAEIEAHLNRHPAIRESVVLAHVDSSDAADKHLIAYYIPHPGPEPTAQELRAHLLSQLPAYMVPSFFVALESFPLTRNGKLDRAALPSAVVPAAGRDTIYNAPQTVAERALAEIWESVLKTEPIGIHENFFELGGDSILSLQIASRANKAGYSISIKDIFTYPTIHQLAQQCTRALVPVYAPQEAATGAQVLLPIHHWFFEQRFENPHHWNQSFLLEAPRELTQRKLEPLLDNLVAAHDALRLRFHCDGGAWAANYASDEPVAIESHDLSHLTGEEQAQALRTLGHQVKSKLHLQDGPLLRAALFDLGEAGKRLLLTIHHLVVDTFSWRVLLEDLERLYRQQRDGDVLSMSPNTTPYQYWAKRLQEHAGSPALADETEYWTRADLTAASPLPRDYPPGEKQNTTQSARAFTIFLSPGRTQDLMGRVHRAYGTRIDDLLLCALARAHRSWSGAGSLLLNFESHGREALFAEVDLARTVGWFTTLYPVVVGAAGESLAEDLKTVKEQLRQIPNNGIGYGMLRYLGELRSQHVEPEVSFTYLGQFDQTLDEGSLFRFAPENAGAEVDMNNRRLHVLDIAGRIQGGQLSVVFFYSDTIHREATIARFAEAFQFELTRLIDHCLSLRSDEVAAGADVAQQSVLATDIVSSAEVNWDRVSPLTYTQLDQWFMYLQSGVPWPVDLEYEINGTVSADVLEQAINAALGRHQAFWARISRRAPVQRFVSPTHVRLPLVDLSEIPEERRARELESITRECRTIDLRQQPLINARLVKLDASRHLLMLAFTHLVLDRVSLAILLGDISYAYNQILRKEPVQRGAALQISEVARAERTRFQGGALERSVAFWNAALRDVRPCALPVSYFVSGAEGHGHAAAVLSDARLGRLKQVSARHGATLQMSVIALVCMALNQASGSDDIALKVHLNGRDDIENQDVIAPLYREFVVRTRIEQRTFQSVLGSVKSFMLEALEHRHCPWIVPAGLLELAKWPKPFRALLPFWNAVSVLATKVFFRRAALYPKILTSYLTYLDFPGKTRAVTLPQGSGYALDVNINLLLQKSTDVTGFVMHGAQVATSARERSSAHGETQWAVRSLDFNFERNVDGDVVVMLTGGGLSNAARATLLDALMGMIEKATDEEAAGVPLGRDALAVNSK